MKQQDNLIREEMVILARLGEAMRQDNTGWLLGRMADMLEADKREFDKVYGRA